MFYSVGIDIAKDDFKACILEYNPVEQSHRVRGSKKFTNTPAGLHHFVNWVDKWVAKKPAPVRVVMEYTGVYYERLAVHLHDNCKEWALSVVLPKSARKFNESEGLRNKTDKIDAYGLALMAARKKLDRWGGAKPFWFKLRSMTRFRKSLVEQQTELKNQLHALNHSAFACQEVKDAAEQALKDKQVQIDMMEKLIAEHIDSNPEIEEKLCHLRSIPSIGAVTIATILAETHGFEHFSSASQLISYAGYDIVVKESGQYKGKRAMSKRGNSHIRAAMYMPVNCLLSRHTEPYYSYYNRLLSRHGIRMKAHVALQKKLLCLMYHLWKKNEAFDAALALRPAGLSARAASPKGDAAVDTSVPKPERRSLKAKNKKSA